MNTSGDAAEQVVRLSLEGFEVAAKLTGSAAKNIAVLLASVLKNEIRQTHKNKGKARLSNMLKSGKELKVFALPQKDLHKFTENARKYGVLYCVLRNRSSKDPNAQVDIIARAEDASKIQRIVDRFEIGTVDKASIIAEAQKNIAERESREKEKPEKSMGEMVVEEAVGPPQKEEKSHQNPSAAKTEKSPLSRQNSSSITMNTGKGEAEERPSVREKLERYIAEGKGQKEAERTEPVKKPKREKPKQPGVTRHQQPHKKKKSKVKAR